AGGGNACGPCNTPPASTCENNTTLRVYSPPGTCGGTQCTYSTSLVTCASSCANGACTGTGWSQLTTGTSQPLTAVWGSAANSVWAGGPSATMLFWNGAVWQARAVPTTYDIRSLGGASATSVFAVAKASSPPFAMLHFDGATWSNISTALSLSNVELWDDDTCIAGVGEREAYWASVEARYNPIRPVLALHRIQHDGAAWSRQLLGEYPLTSGQAQVPCQVQVLPGGQAAIAAGVTVLWNGATLSPLGSSMVASKGIHLASPTDGVAVSGVLHVLTSGTWATLNLGMSPNAMHGTNANRVFIVGYQQMNTTLYPRVSMWDGLGTTALTMPPMATGPLYAVWAAPTGEVFAVGQNGLVLKGP
ncbi:MAG: hypothetical protein JNK82_32555, partial [Myxococcaceae bacterium]|nr:hypothetical protein [Myxococcaceae bacterium]